MTAYHITRAILAPRSHNLGALLADTSGHDAGHRLVWTLFSGADARLFIDRYNKSNISSSAIGWDWATL